MLYNFNNQLDFTRVSNLNATIRRSDRARFADLLNAGDPGEHLIHSNSLSNHSNESCGDKSGVSGDANGLEVKHGALTKLPGDQNGSNKEIKKSSPRLKNGLDPLTSTKLPIKDDQPDRNSLSSLDPIDPFDSEADYRRYFQDAQLLHKQIQVDSPAFISQKDTSEPRFLKLSIHFDWNRLLMLQLQSGSHTFIELNWARLMILSFFFIVLPYGTGEFLKSGRILEFLLAYPLGCWQLFSGLLDGLFWLMEFVI